MIRKALVPVQACWNGMIAVDAPPFYGPKPLRSRALPDDLASMHPEASEFCLLHADNALSALKMVWLNLNVRVAYSAEAYGTVNRNLAWPGTTQRMKGRW
ncbi:hypothetical protein J1614_002871 [Plenodomus biglobosus]|nr:hypothetical protein J1614_002871 [Plenodomus biglobosus]